MVWSVPNIKKCIQILQDQGLTETAARDYMVSIQEDKRADADLILSGDFSRVPALCGAPDSNDIKPIKADIQRITPQAVGAPSYDMEYKRGELPAGLADNIKAFIKEWAASNDIEDISKCDGLQWRAACLYVGEWIKSNNILIDKDAQRARGGRQYDGEKVVKLLEIFQAIATTYKKVPIHTDFISFSGISRNWFFDYEGRGLTSSNVQIVKKCVDIEKAATSAKILNSKDNPLNVIWYEKTRFGIRDNDNIQQIDDKHGGENNALPVFNLPKLQ